MSTPFASPVVSPTKKKRRSPDDSEQLEIDDDVLADAQMQSPDIFLQSRQATPSLHTALDEQRDRLVSAASLQKARDRPRLSLAERMQLGVTSMGAVVRENRYHMHADWLRRGPGKRKRVEEVEEHREKKGETQTSPQPQSVETVAHSM